MTGWEISTGFYPGVLVGMRSYPEPTFVETRILFTFC